MVTERTSKVRNKRAQLRMHARTMRHVPTDLKNQDCIARQLLAELDCVTTPSPQPSPPHRGGEGDKASDGL